ncbi:MAG: TetR family transcriptional regulator [Micrococcales bacterium]|nr:TetR family transcriptional regulator [Micrococcales bacterium]
MATTDGRLARGEASRAAMLAAATRVVAYQGIQALTHRAVAAEAGVSHARVAYHFASAADLRQATLSAAGDRIVDQLGALMPPADAEPRTLDPMRVPEGAAQLAVHMVTDLRDETTTLYTLMAEATRDEGLRTAVGAITDRIADLVEPLSGSRELATTAAAALLGTVLVAMAEGVDQDPEAVRAQAASLVEHFDPHGDGQQQHTTADDEPDATVQERGH